VIIAAFLSLGFGLATSAAINLSMKQTSGPAIPMMKLKTITKRLAMEGDLKQKLKMYVKPAAAGPNRQRRAIVLPAASYSLLMNDSVMNKEGVANHKHDMLSRDKRPSDQRNITHGHRRCTSNR